MRRLVRFATLPVALLLAACSPDLTRPTDETSRQSPVGSPLPSNHAADAEKVGVAIVAFADTILPSPQAIVSKWEAFQASLGTANVASALEDLVDKINTEYGKYLSNLGGSPDDETCYTYEGVKTCQSVLELKDWLIDQIYILAGLDPDASICRLEPLSGQTVCETKNGETPTKEGAVLFPPGVADQLTLVSVKVVTPPLGGLFYQVPGTITLQIKTAPIQDFPDDPATAQDDRPFVVVCFPEEFLPPVDGDRLRLGMRHDDANGAPLYWRILELEDRFDFGTSFCGSALGAASASATPTSWVGKALNLLAPAPLHAAPMMFAFGGVGGSPEEFSDFGVVDRGILGGGAGGSPEEFSPVQLSVGKESNPLNGGVPDQVFTAPASDQVETAILPETTVQTAGLVGVQGVKVRFTLAPTIAPAYDDPSQASFTGCESVTAGNLIYGDANDLSKITAIEFETGDDGKAALDCLNFGTDPGYMRLYATFDPSGLPYDPFAEVCMVSGAGPCNPGLEYGFLIRTVPGPATKITKTIDPAGDYSAGTVLNPQVKVTDNWDNPVVGEAVAWEVTTPGIGAIGTTPTTTAAFGLSSQSWTIGEGVNGLKASITSGAFVTFGLTSEKIALAACTASGTLKKTGLAKYASSGISVVDGGNTGGYRGWVTIAAETWKKMTEAGAILTTDATGPTSSVRGVQLAMSVTGQSSGSGDYPATITAYARKGGVTLLTPIGVLKPKSADKTLKLPGDNGSPAQVQFNLESGGISFDKTDGTDFVVLEFEIQAASTRTFQLWYNTKPASTCLTSQVWNVAPFSSSNSRDFVSGVNLIVRNFAF